MHDDESSIERKKKKRNKRKILKQIKLKLVINTEVSIHTNTSI